METIEVSVITTVKNGSTYLLEMLESVKKQSFRNIEHIIIDDGSTDQTLEILKAFKNKNPNYNMIIIPTSGIGRGNALNLAVSKTNSNIIAVIDADDIWHPLKLEIQYNLFKQTDSVVLATDTILFKEISEVLPKEINELNNGTCISYSMKDLLRSNSISHSSVLINREICKYDPDRKSQFDYELWLRILVQGYKIEKIRFPLSFHRIHENQSFESKMKKVYRWRAYKLKISYAFKSNNIMSIFYSTAKLCFDMFFPRKIRFIIRDNIIKDNKI